MRHLERQKPATAPTVNGLQEIDRLAPGSVFDATTPTTLQAALLAARFGLNTTIARVVAEHAFHTQEART